MPCSSGQCPFLQKLRVRDRQAPTPPERLNPPTTGGDGYRTHPVVGVTDCSLDVGQGLCTLCGMQQTPFVIYCRVSTEEQGRSGLGLEAQLHACLQHVQGQAGTVLSTFQDIASGGDDTRPGLAQALAMCRKVKGAVLLVAMLDRVSRDTAMTATMMKRVTIVSADAPGDGPLVQHIKAAVSEQMRRDIQIKTTLALAAAKRRGVLLGSARPGHWDGREDRRRAGGLAGSEAARKARAARKAALAVEGGQQ